MTTAGNSDIVALQVLGRRIDVVVNLASKDAVQQVRHAWQHCLTDDPEQAPVRIEVPAHDVRSLLYALSREVTCALIDARAGELLMLHAGCIADPTSGRALAVVGPSGAGKSTWVAHHGRGRRYLSDETLAVQSDGRVESLPKPVSIVASDFKDEIPPQELGLLPADGSEHLAGLWLLERADAYARAHLEPVDPLDALVLLSEHASHLPKTAQPLHLMASVLANCGGLFRARYRDTADLAPLVSSVLERS